MQRYIPPMEAVQATGFVLVVEDDEDIRDFAVTVLRESGFRVLEAVNGGVALVLLAQDLPIEVLFTDIVMPGEPDGIGLAERALAMRPDLRVLYATGFAGASRLDHRPVHGPVLNKPYRSLQLADAVDRLVTARRR
jgi:CheY-like chemotaxis protein